MKKIFIGLLAVLVSTITFYFMYGWYDVFPWAVAALIIGYTSKSRRDSIINGAIFGYLVFLVYIFLGYNGKTDVAAMFHFILFNVFFSLVGAIAGIVGGLIGYLIKAKLAKL
ncbi:MAG TPA: DUF6518 family protein [Mucilaginibacter sp.]